VLTGCGSDPHPPLSLLCAGARRRLSSPAPPPHRRTAQDDAEFRDILADVSTECAKCGRLVTVQCAVDRRWGGGAAPRRNVQARLAGFGARGRASQRQQQRAPTHAPCPSPPAQIPRPPSTEAGEIFLVYGDADVRRAGAAGFDDGGGGGGDLRLTVAPARAQAATIARRPGQFGSRPILCPASPPGLEAPRWRALRA